MKRVRVVSLLLCLTLLLTTTACSANTAGFEIAYALGNHYLSEGNYSEAIIAFSAAINIEPRRAEAYAGRGDAFMGSALFEQAVADYQNAIRRQAEVDYYERLTNGYLALEDLESAREALREGYEKLQDPDLWERLTALDHISFFRGGVFSWGENYLNNPIQDAIVTLRDAETGAVVLSYRTDAEGIYSGYALEGSYEFYAHTGDHRPAFVYKAIRSGETVFVENLYLLSEEEQGNGAISGTIYSAVTGEPISGARVWAVENWNQPNPEGQELVQAVTDWQGNYIIPDQPIGYYTVFAECDGYVTASVNGVVSSIYEATADIMLSPALAAGEDLRIVLTWGLEPSDLDSHLIVDHADWSNGFASGRDAYFSNMSVYDGESQLIAQLDVDDTTSYGPETITVYRLQGHEFTYVVHDYTNSGWMNSTALSESEATVTVYSGEGILGIFHVPANQTGTVWVVFSVDGSGVLNGIGEITNW